MKKERKLDRLYAEFDKDYSGKSKEEMEKIINDLEKEVSGKENSLENIDDEGKKENLQKNIEQSKKRLENLKGYTKNKTQIEGILKYRDSLETKLSKEKIIKEDSLKLYKLAAEDLKNVSKKLNDEKYTMTLDQNEYNALLEEKARVEKVMEEQAERNEKASKRILEIEGKIGKCNLAWKQLFVNKSWDDIHRIALEPNTRFTRKINPEKDIPIKGRKTEANVNKEQENIKVDEKAKETTETKALVEQKQGFFRKLWKTFKNWVRGDKKQEEIIGDNENSAESKTTTKKERDAFLEGLRQHVDIDYRKTVKEEKEAQYKEAHKKQTKDVNDGPEL